MVNVGKNTIHGSYGLCKGIVSTYNHRYRDRQKCNNTDPGPGIIAVAGCKLSPLTGAGFQPSTEGKSDKDINNRNTTKSKEQLEQKKQGRKIIQVIQSDLFIPWLEVT